MNLRRIINAAKSALRTQKGRETAARLTDSAADAARRASPKHASKIDQAHRHARKYLDKQ